MSVLQPIHLWSFCRWAVQWDGQNGRRAYLYDRAAPGDGPIVSKGKIIVGAVKGAGEHQILNGSSRAWIINDYKWFLSKTDCSSGCADAGFRVRGILPGWGCTCKDQHHRSCSTDAGNFWGRRSLSRSYDSQQFYSWKIFSHVFLTLTYYSLSSTPKGEL